MLIKELLRLQATQTYLGAIVGGDFNFESHSPEYQELLVAGLRDTHMIASPRADLYSSDPNQNTIVHQEELAMPPSLRQAMTNLPEAEQQRMAEGYQDGMGQARRIDYLFHMGKGPHLPNECLRQTLLGESAALSTPSGSGHFGVLNRYILDPSQR